MADTFADLVRDMTVAGVSGAFIIRMLDLYKVAVSRGEADLAMREGQRKRQKAYRKRIGVTSPLRNAQLSFLLPLNTCNSSPLKEESDGEVYVEAAREGFIGNSRVDFSKGHVLPEGWQPKIDQYEYGMHLGLCRAEIDTAAEDMRLWAGANRNRSVARKADWNLTFKGWLRRVAAKRTSRNGSGGSAFDVSRDLETMIGEGGTLDEPITSGAGAIRRG